MSLTIDVLSARESRRVRVDADRVTVGTAAANEIPLPDDPAVSQLHAVLERFGAGWCVTDLDSSNGTSLNGERIFGIRRVRDRDEIRVGQTRLLILDCGTPANAVTDAAAAAPPLTARERDVLVALCRPLIARDLFTEPAATREIAEELVVTQTAVKQHLSNLYAKFGIAANDAKRRVRLANEALRQGAVSIGDLRRGDGG